MDYAAIYAAKIAAYFAHLNSVLMVFPGQILPP
jgi:hypothetical protein